MRSNVSTVAELGAAKCTVNVPTPNGTLTMELHEPVPVSLNAKQIGGPLVYWLAAIPEIIERAAIVLRARMFF